MQDTSLENQDPFFDAKNLVDGLIEVLRTRRWLAAEHGDVEKLIRKDGFELMRLLLQGHLDERAARNLTSTLCAMKRAPIAINA